MSRVIFPAMQDRHVPAALAITLVLALLAGPVAGQQPAPGAGPGRGAGGRGVGPSPALPAGPAPRRPDGTVMLGGATIKDKGVWLPANGGAQTMVPAQMALPYQDWARGVAADREKNQLEPHTRCKPSGAARQFLTPYGVEFVDLPEAKRVYIFDIGGPHTYRTIYLDRRTHPATLTPQYYGDSVGWWEGDTLIVDTIGFNESFWIDRRGTPHTDALHTVERFTRTDSRTIKYELMIEDPGAFTQPFNTSFNLGWEANTELFEYVCQQGNEAPLLMLGEQKSVDRSSPIVP